MRRFPIHNALTIAPKKEDRKTLATELSEDLFPKITTPEDVKVGDEVIPVTAVRSGTRWLVMQIEADQLLVEERFLLETYLFKVNFKDVRLNPYKLHR